VIFVCQDSEHRDLFAQAADYELTGNHFRPYGKPSPTRYFGRRKVLFVVESEMHEGRALAIGVSKYPPGHRLREDLFRPVRLPGHPED